MIKSIVFRKIKKTVATATVFFFSRCYHKINEAAYDVVTVYVKKIICLSIIFVIYFFRKRVTAWAIN